VGGNCKLDFRLQFPLTKTQIGQIFFLLLFCRDRRGPFRDAQQFDGYENPLWNSMVTKNASRNKSVNAYGHRTGLFNAEDILLSVV